MLVGGDIFTSTGPVRGAMPYCSDVATFITARRWDASTLSPGPLLQAQAAELDAGTLDSLSRQFWRGPATTGWPGHTVHRWQRTGVKIMLWDSPAMRLVDLVRRCHSAGNRRLDGPVRWTSPGVMSAAGAGPPLPADDPVLTSSAGWLFEPVGPRQPAGYSNRSASFVSLVTYPGQS